jgi:hypothetical protein
MRPSVQVTGHWIVSGAEFSPSAAERVTHILFTEKIEPAEICIRGRYRGRPAPGGWGKREFSIPPEHADLVASNSEVLATLERCMSAYRTAGAQEVVLHFNVSYFGQCNIQLTAPLLLRLASLGVDVTLTCFAVE